MQKHRFQNLLLVVAMVSLVLSALSACGSGVSNGSQAPKATATTVTTVGKPILTQTGDTPTPMPTVQPSLILGTYNGELTNQTQAFQDNVALDLKSIYKDVTSISGNATISGLNGSGSFIGFYSKSQKILAFLITPPKTQGSGSGILFTGDLIDNKVKNGNYSAGDSQNGSWSFDMDTMQGDLHNISFDQDGQIALNITSNSVQTLDASKIDGVIGKWTPSRTAGKGDFLGVIKEGKADITVAATDLFATIKLTADIGNNEFLNGDYTFDGDSNPGHQVGLWSASLGNQKSQSTSSGS